MVAFQVPVGPVGRQTAPREMSHPRVIRAGDLLARIRGFRHGRPRVDEALPFGRKREMREIREVRGERVKGPKPIDPITLIPDELWDATLFAILDQTAKALRSA